MTDPIARPGNDDPGIDHATDQVVETWQEAGRQPDAASEDFERMREGFGTVAGGGYADAPSREEQLAYSDRDGQAAADTAAKRATSESGPDA